MNMEGPRHLDGMGKGEFNYDYKYDTLMFRIKGRKYNRSFEFQNFVADIDKEGFITGIRIFDASKVFGTTRYILKNIVDWEFHTRVEEDVVTITFRFSSRIRNRIMPILKSKENFTQQLTQKAPSHLDDSYAKCEMTA